MKNKKSDYEFSFAELIALFEKKSDHQFVLKSALGRGILKAVRIEEGLRVMICNCSFNNRIKMHQKLQAVESNQYFTLAFFLDVKGLQVMDGLSLFNQKTFWDTILASNTSDLRIRFSPKMRIYCLSIQFSTKWLQANLFSGSEMFKDLQQKINSSVPFFLLEAMTSSEKNLLQELLDCSWRRSLGPFYIKSVVMKIVSGFFNKIKVSESFQMNSLHLDTIVSEAEKHLSSQITGKMPNLKEVAKRFSISESTLKRHFVKRFGVPMSTYFFKKKSEFAQLLMNEKQSSIAETAFIVGYTSVHNFVEMYNKYHRQLTTN